MPKQWTAARVRSLRAKLRRGDVVSLWQAGRLLQLVEGKRAGYGKRSHEKIRAKVGGGVMERRLILARRLARWDRCDAKRAKGNKLSLRAVDALLTLDGACRGAKEAHQQMVKARDRRRTLLRQFPANREPKVIGSWLRRVRNARQRLLSKRGKRRKARFDLKYIEGRLKDAIRRLKQIGPVVGSAGTRRINLTVTNIENAAENLDFILSDLLRNEP